MPRFHFHLYNDVDVLDEEGQELSDLDAALAWARNQARNLIGELVKETGRVTLHHRIDIANEQSEVVGTVRFGDVVKIER